MFDARWIDRVRIPTPCHATWDEMPRSGGQRFCDSCGKTVHDFSALTRRDATKLMRKSQGKLCARIVFDERQQMVFRKDREPTVSRLVQISLLSVSALSAQTARDSNPCSMAVRVTDATEAGVAGAMVKIAPRQAGVPERTGRTDITGMLHEKLTAGLYDLEVTSPGFERAVRAGVQLSCDGNAELTVPLQLQVGTVGGVMMAERSPGRLAKAWTKTKAAIWKTR